MSYVVRLEYAYGVCPKCKRVHYLRYLIHNDGLIHKPYEIKCINCNSYFAKKDIRGSGEETAQKPITNYDRLVYKTPEELADELLDLFSAFYFVEWSKDTILDWLKSPVEEADNGT